MTETLHATNQTALPGITLQETLCAFRQAYSFERVQEELWQCLQPRLFSTFQDLDPDRTNQLAAFYEHLEILLSAVYQVPDLPTPAQEQEPALTFYFAGDQRHV